MRFYLSPAAIDRMGPEELAAAQAEIERAIQRREDELAQLKDLLAQAKGRLGGDDADAEPECACSIKLSHTVGSCELAGILERGGERLRNALNAIPGPLWPGGPRSLVIR